MTIWSAIYHDLPYNLCVNLVESFLRVQFKTLALSFGCNIIAVAVKARWWLTAEHYHVSIRKIANKLSVIDSSALINFIVIYASLDILPTVRIESFAFGILRFLRNTF